MITKRPIIHIYDLIFSDVSWELSEKLRKFLGKDYNVEYHSNENINGFTFSGPEIPQRVLDNIEARIPEWAKEIKDKNKQEEDEALKEIKGWIKNTPIPQVPFKKCAKSLHKVILELREDLENEANKGKVLPCGLGDIKDLINLLNLIEADKIEAAKKAIWSMDTGTRGYISSSLCKMLTGEDE